MNRISVVTVCLVSLGATACGQAPKPTAVSTAPVGVFTSGPDCAESQKLNLSDCNILLRMALETHQRDSKSYTSLRLCAEAEGPDNCERADTNTFRRRLLAFQVTFSAPPTAAPLYAPKEKGVLGFTTQDKAKTLLTVDETVIFSADAKTVAESYFVLN